MWSGIVWIKRWKRSSIYLHEDIKAWCDRDACSRCKNLLSESGNVYTQTDDDEQLKEAGVPAELIRISLGLEDKEDLIADISNALDAIRD